LTTLAKVFIVILAVASIAFSMLVIQYTAQALNYKELADKNQSWALSEQDSRTASDTLHTVVQAHLNRTIQDQQKKLAELSDKLESSSAQSAIAKNTALAEGQKALSLAGQVAQLNDMFQAAETERKQLQDQLTAARKQITALQTENFTLGKTNQELERAKRLFEQQIRLMREQNVSLEQTVQTLRSRLQTFATGAELPGPERITGTAAPVAEPEAAPIMGQITEVRGSDASISVGSAQGVKPGMEFIVYRGGDYLGRLRITKVLPDQSAGQLVQTRGVVRQGDSITDKLQF